MSKVESRRPKVESKILPRNSLQPLGGMGSRADGEFHGLLGFAVRPVPLTDISRNAQATFSARYCSARAGELRFHGLRHVKVKGTA
jgi:hypothetical protein